MVLWSSPQHICNLHIDMKAKLLSFKQTRFECIFNPLIKQEETKWSIGIWNTYNFWSKGREKNCYNLPTMVKYYFETFLLNLIYLMPSWTGKDCKINLIWKTNKKWNIILIFTSIVSSILVLIESVFLDPYTNFLLMLVSVL